MGGFGLSGAAHAFLYDAAGNLTDLGTLGGTVSLALDINNNGVIVGYSELQPDQNHVVHTEAFVYKNGQMSALDVFGSQNSSATAINESGQIVGGYVLPGTNGQPFLIDPTTGTHDIGLPGLAGGALDINDFGTIVVYSQRSSTAQLQEAFVYDPTDGLQFLRV